MRNLSSSRGELLKWESKKCRRQQGTVMTFALDPPCRKGWALGVSVGAGERAGAQRSAPSSARPRGSALPLLSLLGPSWTALLAEFFPQTDIFSWKDLHFTDADYFVKAIIFDWVCCWIWNFSRLLRATPSPGDRGQFLAITTQQGFLLTPPTIKFKLQVLILWELSNCCSFGLN